MGIKLIDIPFGANDSELIEFEYRIPDGFEGAIEDGVFKLRKKVNEDDRIITLIISYLNICRSYQTETGNAYIDKCIEWLEKQKEKKPNYCHYGGDPSVERCKYCSAACSARLTEEQKPAEWSKKPHRFCDDTLEAIDKDREMREQHPELYPAEWSDGTFERLNTLANFIKCSGYEDDAEFLDGVIDKIKSLRPQQKQEWSDEDKKPYDDVLSGLKYAYENLLDSGSFDSADDVGNAFCWFKNRFPYLANNSRVWGKEDEEMVQFYLDYTDNKLGNWPNCEVVRQLERFKEWVKSRRFQ